MYHVMVWKKYKHICMRTLKLLTYYLKLLLFTTMSSFLKFIFYLGLRSLPECSFISFRIPMLGFYEASDLIWTGPALYYLRIIHMHMISSDHAHVSRLPGVCNHLL